MKKLFDWNYCNIRADSIGIVGKNWPFIIQNGAFVVNFFIFPLLYQ